MHCRQRTVDAYSPGRKPHPPRAECALAGTRRGRWRVHVLRHLRIMRRLPG